MAKTIEYLSLIKLFEKFVADSVKGKRLQKNGSVISKATTHNYQAVLTNLKRFSESGEKEWLFNIRYRHSKANFEKEKRYYKNFYLQYTNFLYSKGCIDNYVGMQIQIIKTFFCYMITSKGHEMGTFYKDFYTRKEEIPVIVVNQEQL